MELQGKVAVVTGAGSGIGLALTRRLAAQGATVVEADIHPDARHVVDVGQEAQVRGLVADTVERHGRLDYIFNNAGIAATGPFEEVTTEDWERIVNVNLWGVIHGTRAAYAQMRRQGSGHIVNTASIAGRLPSPLQSAYGTTKHAVVGLSTTLRLEAAAHGVRVSVVCPGAVATAIWGPNGPPASAVGADRAAQDILRGVARNQAVIVFPAGVRWFDRLHHLVPRLTEPRLARAAQRRARSD